MGEKQSGCYFNGNNNQHINQIQSDEAIAQENIRLNLEVSHLKKEIEFLTVQIDNLKEINRLLKEKNKSYLNFNYNQLIFSILS